MRNLSPTLTAKLQTGVTNLCWCWKIIRTDGVVFGFTDHDMDLHFDGMLWQASTGLVPGVIETRLGFETGSAGMAGSILHDSLKKEDLRSGKFGQARVEIWRVDWNDPNDRVGIWAGEIGDIQMLDTIFTAELVANSRKLERSIGRVFSKACDAELGDARCTKDIGSTPWREAVTISEVLTSASFSIASIIIPENDWYVLGSVVWEDAEKATNQARINAHYTAGQSEVFELLLPPEIPMTVGDAVGLIVGCDKTLAHCTKRFSNTNNFRGCPFMPGNDELLATPFSG